MRLACVFMWSVWVCGMQSMGSRDVGHNKGRLLCEFRVSGLGLKNVWGYILRGD